jgi:2-keto-myo-inositol isomerase
MADAHRILVDKNDRLGNIAQIEALVAAGYVGPISFEAFAQEIHDLEYPVAALRASIDYIRARLTAKAA